MNSFKIISDSSCDLPTDILKEHDIDLIPYYVTFDGEKYYRETIDLTIKEFYDTLKSRKVYPKTSLPPVMEYYDAFKKYAAEKMDILVICLTSKFSGSYQSAHNAKNMLMEEHPGCNIRIMDSTSVTFAQGLIVLEAARLRKNGKSIEETENIINKMKSRIQLVFTVNSLDYLARGGRIGLVSSFAGSLLNIKPIIKMTDGELVPFTKVRGRKKAIEKVIDVFFDLIDMPVSDGLVCIGHSDSLDEVDKFRQLLMNTNRNLNMPYPVFEIGTTIGTHIGPSVLALAFCPNTDIYL